MFTILLWWGVPRQKMNFDGKFWPFSKLFVHFRHLKGPNVIWATKFIIYLAKMAFFSTFWTITVQQDDNDWIMTSQIKHIDIQKRFLLHLQTVAPTFFWFSCKNVNCGRRENEGSNLYFISCLRQQILSKNGIPHRIRRFPRKVRNCKS